MIIATCNENHYHWSENKKFMVFDNNIYNCGQIICNAYSESSKKYFDIKKLSNTLEKEYTNEIIQYTFSNDARNTIVNKNYYTKDRQFKKSKEIKYKNSDFYIELLNDGFKPVD